MTFTAIIKRHSAVWKLWREQHRTGGTLCDIAFTWVAGNDYVSAVLTQPQINAVKTHPGVRLEVVHAYPPAITVLDTVDWLMYHDNPVHSDPVLAPGHTDLMVSPETIDAFLEKNPPPDIPVRPTLDDIIAKRAAAKDVRRKVVRR